MTPKQMARHRTSMLRIEAANLARFINDPLAGKDLRREASMRLSILLARLGALGVDRAAGPAENGEDADE